ncbi:MAG: D-2-hydroxyacid dehydrogenase [Thiolinea sp.]
MNNLMILSPEAGAYADLLADAKLPELNIMTACSPEEARGRLADAGILMGLPAYLADVLDDMPQLQWVQSTSAGVNELCVEGLRRDYQLTNVKDVFGPLMSEYVFAYLLAHERSMLPLYRDQQQRAWQQWDRYPYRRLSDLTLGVVGLGSIGQCIAATGAHFGMRVLGVKRNPQPVEHVETVYDPQHLDAFLSQVDYLVLVLPATAETFHFVDEAFLRRMKPGAILMNVGRGSTVDETALLAALQNGTIKGAVLDVFEQEPLPQDSPLWSQSNVMITPHNSALSFPEHISGIFVDNYLRFIRGEPLRYRVDFSRGY